VVIPAAYRRTLGIEAGGQVLMLLQDGELRIVGRDAAVRLAQEIVAKYVPRGALLSDELIAERRAEAQREGGAHGV
jgi:bifunctional DNA-binding transcriptional regulator/antitoxin component of YhaV-PrlF toxin-antitoxin module